MYNQLAQLPIIFQVNEGIIDQIPHFLERNNFSFKNIVLVSGSSNSFSYAQAILNTMDCKSYSITKDDALPVENLKEYCLTNNIDFIIGIGGGSVIDIVKRVSLLTQIENLLVPTVISNDGLISPISVIKDENGKTHSLPGKMPLGIIVDIDIIMEAPAVFLQSAAGDILSNISATNDWVMSNKNTGEYINDLSYILSRSAALSLINHESKDIRNRSFVKHIINSQINSGLAMALSGTSRPCSGSEHLLSHAIDFHKLSENTLHGLQVGSTSVFCLFLQKKLEAKSLNYIAELGIPFAFHKLNENLFENLQEIHDTALIMRPGRYTVLSQYTRQEFYNMYNKFIDFIRCFNNHAEI